jgi:hypothetical protein
MYTYQDKYQSVPGDDSNAATNLVVGSVVGLVPTTSGTGQLDTGTWVGLAAPAVGNKSSVFWQHVRLAGLATGAASSGEAKNAIGGKLGVTSNNSRPASPAGAIGDYIACSSGIPAKVAQQMDIVMDDGVPNTGNLFASLEGNTGAIVATSAANATAYTQPNNYTVCLAF